MHVNVELHKFLIAYRSTPDEITGESPAKRMFRREIRTKLSEFHEQMCDTDQTARDRDAELKQRGKDYADRNARDSNVESGDKVLLQQAKKDKLSTCTLCRKSTNCRRQNWKESHSRN